MTNIRLTKQDIFKAAEAIIAKGLTPTQDSIRNYLGRGSRGTIHKYLQQWKLACFRNNKAVYELSTEQNFAKFHQETQQLEGMIAKLQEQNKIIALELVKTEKENIALTQNYQQNEKQLNSLQVQYNDLEKKAAYLEEAYQTLKEERTTMLTKMEQDKDKLIESLRNELKQAHLVSLEKIRDTSFSGHDALMQEKVITINLQEEVKALKTKIGELKQELERANFTIGPLRKKIAQQEKLITEVVTVEQMREYEQQKQAADFVSN